MKIFLVRIDHGQGFINYYQPTTLEKLINFIKRRGCDKLTIKNESSNKYEDFTMEEFKQKYGWR